jgi:hypothetical protein
MAAFHSCRQEFCSRNAASPYCDADSKSGEGRMTFSNIPPSCFARVCRAERMALRQEDPKKADEMPEMALTFGALRLSCVGILAAVLDDDGTDYAILALERHPDNKLEIASSSESSSSAAIGILGYASPPSSYEEPLYSTGCQSSPLTAHGNSFCHSCSSDALSPGSAIVDPRTGLVIALQSGAVPSGRTSCKSSQATSILSVKKVLDRLLGEGTD